MVQVNDDKNHVNPFEPLYLSETQNLLTLIDNTLQQISI